MTTASDPLPPPLAASIASWCRAQHRAETEPVPYSLTPAAEAALERPFVPSPYPGSDDRERLAEWCGFASAADMEAAYEADAREQAAQSEMEAR